MTPGVTAKAGRRLRWGLYFFSPFFFIHPLGWGPYFIIFKNKEEKDEKKQNINDTVP